MVAVTDKSLIEKFKKVFGSKNIQDIHSDIDNFNSDNSSDFLSLKKRQNEIINPLRIIDLEKLFSLWFKKWGQLDYEKDSQKKKEIFDKLIDLCSEIYPCLTNLVCKSFIVNSPIRYEEIEISNLNILNDSEKFICVLKTEQEFSFGTSYYKRDNIIHQFRVFLLGAYLLLDKTVGGWIVDWIWQDLLDFFPGSIRENLGKFNKKEIVLSIWGLASLFHDCGRGIQTFYEHLKEIKESFEKIFLEFRLPMPDINTNFCLNELWSKKKETFFKLLEYFLTKEESRWSSYYKNIKDNLKEAFEIPKHGIISAILISFPQAEELLSKWEAKKEELKSKFTRTGFYKDIGENFEELKSGIKISEQLPIITEIIIKITLPIYAALAVAFHDIEQYWFVTHLTTLLVLCDNLQEWKRLTKLGDQTVMIFPCEKIKLNFEKEKKVKISAEISYSCGKKDGLEQEIFKRCGIQKKNGRNLRTKYKSKQRLPCSKIFIIQKMTYVWK